MAIVIPSPRPNGKPMYLPDNATPHDIRTIQLYLQDEARMLQHPSYKITSKEK